LKKSEGLFFSLSVLMAARTGGCRKGTGGVKDQEGESEEGGGGGGKGE